MDKLEAMRVFVRVVESGSFSAAAREAGSTQSRISKQVAALEQDLGARLLHRTTRALALTDEGERYFQEARRLVSEIAEAESLVHAGQQQLRGWLRVAASGGFGRLHVLPLVQTFLQRHPGVRIDLRLSDGFVDLVEQGIDLAVRVGHLSDSSLVARRVGTTTRRLVAHRELVRRLEQHGPPPPRAPEDLLQHDCLVYTALAARNTWTFIAAEGAGVPAGTERSVRVEGSLQTDSSEVIRAAVLAGMGIGYSPDWLFRQELARGEVVQLMPAWQAPSLPIHLVCPAQRQQAAKVRAFSDHMAQALATSA